MKLNIFLSLIFISFIAYAFSSYYPTGIVGLTEKDGAIGCICHNFQKTDSVNVWIEGPDSLVIGSSAEYKIYLTGGPAVSGGFNLAAIIGKVYSIDTLTKRVEYVQGDTQLTHSQPLNFSGDTLFWRFVYEAPDTITTDTIYSVGNSTNGDGIPTDADQWNFGSKFAITIYDSPISVQDEFIAGGFELYQNYPNPFNPGTLISWRSPKSGWQTIKLYDSMGREIETIVSGYYEAGSHSELFIVNSELPSGIYYYRLESDKVSITRKMLLLK